MPEPIDNSALAHIPEWYRGKVARDLLRHTTADNHWNQEQFNPLNDYERHLYALFLKLSGIPIEQIAEELSRLATDVESLRRPQYVYDVLHSSIVGFSQEDGSTIGIPENQVISS